MYLWDTPWENMPLGQNGRLLAQISLHTPILSDQSLCSLLTKFYFILKIILASKKGVIGLSRWAGWFWHSLFPYAAVACKKVFGAIHQRPFYMPRLSWTYYMGRAKKKGVFREYGNSRSWSARKATQSDKDLRYTSIYSIVPTILSA